MKKGNHFTLRLVFALGLLLLSTSIWANLTYGQSYDPLHEPSSSNDWIQECRNGSGWLVAGCSVQVYIQPYPNTNYHTLSRHTSPQPKSTPNPASGYTNAYGYFSFKINTTGIGQAEKVRTYIQGPGVPGHYSNWVNFGVGYPLSWNDHPENATRWVKVGATPEHGNTTSANHWMAQCAGYGIYYVTYFYIQAHPEQTAIGMNDMSLQYGGKFDLKNPTYSAWDFP